MNFLWIHVKLEASWLLCLLTIFCKNGVRFPAKFNELGWMSHVQALKASEVTLIVLWGCVGAIAGCSAVCWDSDWRKPWFIAYFLFLWRKQLVAFWKIRISPHISVEKVQLVVRAPHVLPPSSISCLLLWEPLVLQMEAMRSSPCLPWASRNIWVLSLCCSLLYPYDPALCLAHRSCSRVTFEWRKERMNKGRVSEFLWALSVLYNSSLASASIRGNLINLMSKLPTQLMLSLFWRRSHSCTKLVFLSRII